MIVLGLRLYKNFMEYQYKEMDQESKEINFNKGGVWKYIPLKSFLSTEKDKESIIFGDVTGVVGRKNGKCVSMQKDGEKKILHLFRYQHRISLFDSIIGYIPVRNTNGKEGYVRIRKKSIKKISSAMLLVLMIIGIVVFAFNYNQDSNLDQDAIAYQLPDGVKNTDPDSIMLPGYDVLEMDYASHKVDIALLNPEGNDCYFRYSVILKSDQTVLYQTGLIKPGMAVTSFTIDEDLAKGSYPIIIKVEASDLKDPDNTYNGGAIEAVLEVK